MRRSDRLSLAVLLSFWLFAPPHANACPNCKEAVAAQPGEVASMAKGYNWSVLLMLAMPFTMLSTGAFVVVRAARRGTLPEL